MQGAGIRGSCVAGGREGGMIYGEAGAAAARMRSTWAENWSKLASREMPKRPRTVRPSGDRIRKVGKPPTPNLWARA